MNLIIYIYSTNQVNTLGPNVVLEGNSSGTFRREYGSSHSNQRVRSVHTKQKPEQHS